MRPGRRRPAARRWRACARRRAVHAPQPAGKSCAQLAAQPAIANPFLFLYITITCFSITHYGKCIYWKTKRTGHFGGPVPPGAEQFAPLKQLERIGYVGKRHPVKDNTVPKRHVCYEITDALLRFWFHFIYPHESQIRSQSKEMAFQT